TAVITLIPNTRDAENVFRSAWVPAPPPESEPAIVSALGTPIDDRSIHAPGWGASAWRHLRPRGEALAYRHDSGGRRTPVPHPSLDTSGVRPADRAKNAPRGRAHRAAGGSPGGPGAAAHASRRSNPADGRGAAGGLRRPMDGARAASTGARRRVRAR